MSYPIKSDEYPSLATVAVGVTLIAVALPVVVVTWGSYSPVFFAALVAGAVGQFLVPYGVYKQAEVLSEKSYLWSPSFPLIAACTLPVVGAVFGAYYLVKRRRVARGA